MRLSPLITISQHHSSPYPNITYFGEGKQKPDGITVRGYRQFACLRYDDAFAEIRHRVIDKLQTKKEKQLRIGSHKPERRLDFSCAFHHSGEKLVNLRSSSLTHWTLTERYSVEFSGWRSAQVALRHRAHGRRQVFATTHITCHS